jgi:hypothetical protein
MLKHSRREGSAAVQSPKAIRRANEVSWPAAHPGTNTRQEAK